MRQDALLIEQSWLGFLPCPLEEMIFHGWFGLSQVLIVHFLFLIYIGWKIRW